MITVIKCSNSRSNGLWERNPSRGPLNAQNLGSHRRVDICWQEATVKWSPLSGGTQSGKTRGKRSGALLWVNLEVLDVSGSVVEERNLAVNYKMC